MEAKFRELPATVQERLSQLTRGTNAARESAAEVCVVPTASATLQSLGAALGILVAGGALVYGVTLGSWNGEYAIFLAALTFGGTWLALSQGRGVWEHGQSAVHPSIVATPILLAQVGLEKDPVQMHYLRDIREFNATHQHFNGGYTGTDFRCAFADGVLLFKIKSKQEAERLMAFLRSTGDLVRRWSADGVIEKRIRDFDWIGADASRRGSAPPAVETKGWRRLLEVDWGHAVLAAVAMALLTPAAFGVNLLQREMRAWQGATAADNSRAYATYLEVAPLQWYETEARQRFDDRTFTEAKASGKATPLRTYLADFPSGRHVQEAQTALAALYGNAERVYRAGAGDADPEAADGMSALLRYLGQQMSPLVTIAFAEPEGIDGKAIDAYLRASTGSSKIHGVGPSFTAERNSAREYRVVDAMQAAIRRVFGEDLLDLRAGTMEDEGPRFLVRYRVTGSGDYYTARSQDGLPLEARDIYAGIRLAFDFSTQVPGSEFPPDPDPLQGYLFHTEALPAANFSVRSASAFGAAAAPDESSVYDTMVDTAFQRFTEELAMAFGLNGAAGEGGEASVGDVAGGYE